MNKLEPYRLEGFEYYSTCLWHLKRSTDLVFLTNYALEKSLFAPETWCVAGNCYSLQREHETAIKFFHRAIQVDQNFAYAFTLCGHEYVANEDFKQANQYYNLACVADDNHYNAWWGQGNIAMKQEDFQKAQHYFKCATERNARSA